MSLNIKIANHIKNMDYYDLMIEHFHHEKQQVKEDLSNNISLYLQQNAQSEEHINELLRFLYWFTDIGTTEISILVDMTTQKIVSKVGTLLESRQCTRCSAHYNYERKSRSDIGPSICPGCIASETKERDKNFLNRWTEKKNLPKIKDYSLYLSSTHWKSIRKEALSRANYKCSSCSARDCILEVHHNTYERLGRELQTDLIVLCKPCHKRIHDLNE